MTNIKPAPDWISKKMSLNIASQFDEIKRKSLSSSKGKGKFSLFSPLQRTINHGLKANATPGQIKAGFWAAIKSNNAASVSRFVDILNTKDAEKMTSITSQTASCDLLAGGPIQPELSKASTVDISLALANSKYNSNTTCRFAYDPKQNHEPETQHEIKDSLTDISLATLLRMGEKNPLPPLHYASKDGHKDCIRILLDAKADINQVDDTSSTALHIACNWARDDIVKLLLDEKANPNMINDAGETPLACAMKCVVSSLRKVTARREEDVAKLRKQRFEDNCFDIDLQKEKKAVEQSPDPESVDGINIDLIRGVSLANLLINSNLENMDSCMAWSCRCYDMSIRMLKYFHIKGGRFDCQSYGWNLLLICVGESQIPGQQNLSIWYKKRHQAKNFELFKFLLDNGADPNFVDSDGLAVLTLVFNYALEAHATYLIRTCSLNDQVIRHEISREASLPHSDSKILMRRILIPNYILTNPDFVGYLPIVADLVGQYLFPRAFMWYDFEQECTFQDQEEEESYLKNCRFDPAVTMDGLRA